MNQKKPRKRSKKLSTTKINKKILKTSLLVFLALFLIALSIYFIPRNEDNAKNIPTTDINKTQVITKESIFPKSINKELSSNELFEEKFNINEKNSFEEYNSELDKIIEDRLEREDFINKENEIIQKKVEEIKQNEKNKEYKKDLKEQTKLDEKSIVTKKDNFIYDKKSRPKIAIIIDDVSTQAQKETILAMGYKITMAFLPPTSGHPESARIAQNLPFHMIHFPMQASSAFKGAEINTLTINDSYETIENRVKQLRAWYPNAIYTNNHTGSVFTENEEAMDKLFRALKKYNFIFVDSRTSNKSVAKKYAQKYNMPYIVRNTFIDNEENYQYIQNQLKQAIEIAKKQGYAIAIGHPHSITLKVLKESKNLLKDVEPIFVNQLPYL